MDKDEAEKAWAAHFAKYQAAVASGASTASMPSDFDTRVGDWKCPKCKKMVFATKYSCFKCGAPKPRPGEVQKPKTKFAIRGDNLMQTRHGQSKYATKKHRNFKGEFEETFWNVFGECIVDHALNVGCHLSEIITNISMGDTYDIICVGISIQDFLDANWEVVMHYPPNLDAELERLAEVLKAKGKGSLVLVGGPASFWKRPPRWDAHVARARNTLRRAGIQVVPSENVDDLFGTLELGYDNYHIANIDSDKENFAKAWASWLLTAGSNQEFGRQITHEAFSQAASSHDYDRERSPRRGAQTYELPAIWY
mmetsp:Transcript_67913/g.106122  ORF Transcript_67913/g.106122 Transcript_67913/m.106122 type:complete len:310 (-) Transcript_67913:87-1016(-)